MSDLKRISGIDINQDMDFQWREWRLHHVAWVFFGAILLAGLLGLLGQGPLSGGRAGEAGGPIALEYERIDRFGAPTGLRVMLAANAGSTGSARIAFNREFMDGISIEEIVPEPTEAETSAEEVMYTFAIDNTSQPASIRMDFEHERIGTLQGMVRLEGGPQLEFSVFVWP
jgi:hypothetical protein